MVKIKTNLETVTIIANKRIFVNLFKDILKEKNYKKYIELVKEIKGETAEINEFICCGIKYIFNKENLSIDIISLPKERKNITTYIRKSISTQIYQEKKPEYISGSFSLYINQPYKKNKNSDGYNLLPFSAKIPSFINYKGYVFENNLTYASNSSLFLTDSKEDKFINAKINRDYSYISTIFEDYNTLLSIGDVKTDISGFNTGPLILGFSIQKDKKRYSFNKREASKIGQTFLSLENDSIVEIYINGRKRNRLKLRAGNHDIVDFAMDNGFNNIEIRIEDIYGKIEIINYNDFFYGEIIRKGESKYEFSAGQVAYKNQFKTMYVPDLYFASGNYAKGFEDFTAIIAAQGSNNSFYSFGGKIIFPTIHGLFSYLKNFTTFKKEKEKEKTEFSYKYANNGFLLSAHFISQDKGYTYYSYTDVNSFKSTNKALSLTYVFDSNNLSSSISEINSSNIILKQISTSFLYKLTDDITLETSISDKRYKKGGRNDTLVSFAFRWSPGKKSYKLEYSKIRNNNGNTNNYRGRFDYNKNHKYSSSYDFEYDKSKTHKSINTNLKFKTQKYNTSVSYNRNTTDQTKVETGNFKYETGIVFTNKVLTMTSPLRDSFILVNNTFDEVDIPNLSYLGFETNDKISAHPFPSFSKRKIYIDEIDLPIFVELEKTEETLISSYKSGIYIPISIKKFLIVRGTLLNEEGNPLKLTSLILNNNNNNNKVKLFTNSKGRFVYSEGRRGEKYKIDAGERTYIIDVPKNFNKNLRVINIKQIKPIKK